MVNTGSSTHTTPGKTVKKIENRLTRETPFVSNIKFRANLPEVPCDPKMLVAVLQPEKLSQFNITTLEQDMRQDLILEGGVGIPLSLLDTQRYAVPDHLPALAPEDAALVMGPTTEEGPGAVKRRERLRGEGAELSWLMRTTYIANDMEERRQQKNAEKSGAAHTEGEAFDRDAQIATIEASFEEARAQPVHIRDPTLVPVEIVPVLPDLDRWRENYVRMAFDSDPTADHDRLASLPAETVRQIADNAIIKSFTLPGDAHRKAEKLVGYMLPLEVPVHSSLEEPSSSRDDAEVSTSYEWVREYNYKVHNDEDHHTFWFQFHNGHVSFTDVNTKLALVKRGRQATIQAHQRPSGVNVKRRRRSAAEEEAGDKKLRGLTGEQ
ncbi:RNA polymerase II-associated factor 1 homolog [Coccomyxa sp. Obi]|nr:RNA polymerase II-associated factor 1 homolog [Coccomyxa sp. Obi]